MISKRFLLVATLCGAVAGMFWVTYAADSPETVEKMMRRRRMQRLMNPELERNRVNVRWNPYADGGGRGTAGGPTAAGLAERQQIVNPVFRIAGVPPPDPVGSVAFGNTSFDAQHDLSQGYQTARWWAADIVHFTWMFWDEIPASIDDADRFVNYTSYTISSATWNQPYSGVSISLGVFARGGYTDGDADDDNAFHAFLHQRAEAGSLYTSWHSYFPTPGSALHIDDELTSTEAFGEVMWPRGRVQQNPNPQSDFIHVVSHGANEDPRDRIVYWRNDGWSWQGPVAVDSNPRLAYTIATDPNSQKATITLLTDREFSSGNQNVAYYESQTEGAGWISGTELGPANKNIITNYNDPNGPQAWGHTSTNYDLSGYLHIVWDEQRVANSSYDIAIRHYSDSAFQTRPVALGYWTNEHTTGVFNLHLTKVTMGIGDGATLCQGGAQSNKNYVYVVYTQLGGSDAASQADASLAGYYNGELYLSVSNSSGRTWAPPVNISNTKTPGCNPGATPAGGTNPPRPDSVCRSEHWATIGPYVHDIDIFFVEDNDAGGIPQGEGTWQISRVMYMRLPGGTQDAQYVCPVIAANYAAFLNEIPECEFHAPRGQFTQTTLALMNLGNASMTGNISKVLGASWLTLGTGGNYMINAGDPDKIVTVTMSAVGISTEGLYQDTIRVTHNAPNVASPQDYPIDFFVVDEFFCLQDVNLKTGVASPGSLALDVRSDARFASQDREGGLWRYVDSSFSIFDASLLVAHGPQPYGDTTVFHRFFDRNDPGQYGFRAQGDLRIDTSKYSTGGGYATACARMVTKDSMVGVTVEWIFPQDPDSDEFVLARYSFYTYDNGDQGTISNVVAGLLADLDVVPAARYGSVQSGVENQNGGDLVKGLIWQQGQDTAGHVPPNPLYTADRYRGGIEYIGPGTLVGAQVGNNVQDIQPGGGPKSEWLYRTLVSLSGINTPALPDTDMYSIMTLAKGVELGNPRKAIQIVVAFISDTLDETSFKATADKAKAYATAIGLTSGNTSLPCHGNPQCDGVASVQDVTIFVDVAFRGVAPVFDPCCPYERTDVDCDGMTTVPDIVRMINVAFRGANTATMFCHPCGGMGPGPGPSQPAEIHGSVVVESKVVPPNATGVQVGVFVTNDVDLTALVLPLEVRDTDGNGSYMTGNPGAFSFNVPTGNRIGASPLTGSVTKRLLGIPSSNTCSGPVSHTFTGNSAIDNASPDGILWASLSLAGPPNLWYLPSGSDYSAGVHAGWPDASSSTPYAAGPSFNLTFNVNSVLGTFEVDTCCITPANHLYGIGVNHVRFNFTKGVITINPSAASLDCNRSYTDPYLLTCPKGDIPFEVHLVGSNNQPWIGDNSVYLDFSSCTSGEFIPKPGLYPSWPRVYSPAPSDANGVVRFAIAAGGDCADCNVSVYASCGLIGTVAVRSVDVDGDAVVSPLDYDPSQGICRDFNADGQVDNADLTRFTNHFDHRFSQGNCDWLAQTIELVPDMNLRPGQQIYIRYTVDNNPSGGTCRVDSVAIYQSSFSTDPGTGVATLRPNVTLPAGSTYTDSIPFTVPADSSLCIRTVTYSNCCTTPPEQRRCVDLIQQCPPKAWLYEFKSHGPAVAEQRRVFSHLPPGWTFDTVWNWKPDTSLVVIATSDQTDPGTTGSVAVLFYAFGKWYKFVFAVRQGGVNGDLCGGAGGTVDCQANVQDVACLINYIFRGGVAPIPDPPEHGDISCDDVYNVVDVVQLVNYVFRGGGLLPDCSAGPMAQ